MDAEGDLYLGLENYHHCAHTGVLSDGRNAHATNSPSHMCCTQRCVSVSAASHADTAGPHLVSAAVFVLFCFFSMQMFQNYFVVCKCGLKNSPCSRACWQRCQQLWWITLPPTALVCTPTNTHYHIDHTVCDLFFAFFIHFFCAIMPHVGWQKKALSAQIPSWNY